MIELAVFDFDGTLVDSNTIKDRCFQDVVRDLSGGSAALAEARRRGGDRYRIFDTVARRLAGSASPDEVTARGRRLAGDYSRRCLEAIARAPERRGAAAALSALKRRGVAIWINSATPERDLPALIEARGIAPLVDGALGAPRSKVDNLRKLLTTYRVSPRRAVMVGDSPDDVTAAHLAGTWFVGVTAENRIPRARYFAMPDLVRLPGLMASLARVPGARRR